MYATYADVVARAGRLRGAFGNADAPDESEVVRIIGDVAAELDAQMTALGVDPIPVTDATAKRALVGINADGALLIALPACFPSGEADEAAGDLLDAVRARFNAAIAALAAGQLAAVAALVAASATAGEGANFWTDNPTYDVGIATEALTHTGSVLPAIRKGMKL